MLDVGMWHDCRMAYIGSARPTGRQVGGLFKHRPLLASATPSDQSEHISMAVWQTGHLPGAPAFAQL